MIRATRKDGNPVAEGDRVLVVWDQGLKLWGSVTTVGKTIRLSTRGYVDLQTYTVRCDDGVTRPAHAWHIKVAIKTKSSRKFAA